MLCLLDDAIMWHCPFLLKKARQGMMRFHHCIYHSVNRVFYCWLLGTSFFPVSVETCRQINPLSLVYWGCVAILNSSSLMLCVHCGTRQIRMRISLRNHDIDDKWLQSYQLIHGVCTQCISFYQIRNLKEIEWKQFCLTLWLEIQNSITHKQATLFVDCSTNTTNNLFVDPQKNLFVAICGLL